MIRTRICVVTGALLGLILIVGCELSPLQVNPQAGAVSDGGGADAAGLIGAGGVAGVIVRCTDGVHRTISEFNVSASVCGPYGCAPEGITTGPDGNLWFTDTSANSIGRMTLDGAVTFFLIPTENVRPVDIINGPDGNLWFTETQEAEEAIVQNSIGRITPSGTVTEFPLPIAHNFSQGITAGPDGSIWFTETGVNARAAIGRITPSGMITEFPLPFSESLPEGITAGPDGNLWFAEWYGNAIGRITPSGMITEFSLPFGSWGPAGITTGPDGNLWFTELLVPNLYRIGRSKLGGEYSQFQLPAGTTAKIIVTGPDGNLWFASNSRDDSRIIRITPTGTIAECPLPTAESWPYGIAVGPDGNLWFTESGSGKIGRVTP